MVAAKTLSTPRLACLALVAVAGCSAPPPDESLWLENLLQDRQLKDEFFREGPDSPVPVERRGALLPIRYYDPDPVYRVPAALEVSPDQPVFDIPTSTGEIRLMQRVGILKFALNGQPIRLSALAETPVRSIDSLFIMFKDATNESETYAGGRYLDLPRTVTGHYDLDFNRAYHPTCYYDEGYDCPYPPPENRLTLAIPAGERLAPGMSGFSPGVVPPPPDDDAAAVDPQTKGPVKNNFTFLAADPSRLAALLVGRILPVCSLLAPCHPGAPTPKNANLFLTGP